MNRAFARQYEDPRWQYRSKALIQKRRSCEWCNRADRLSVHHGFYEPGVKIWEYPDDVLWVLCKNCHATMDEFRRTVQRLVGRVRPQDAPAVIKFLQGVTTRRRSSGGG